MRRDAPAKINIFLKITGTRGGYHELRSRFVRVDSLHDTLSLEKKRTPGGGFELVCDTPLPEKNTLSTAYALLKEEAPGIEALFKEYALHLKKRIPAGAGLGGGSSDAAAFLHLCNEVCSLDIPTERLALIGQKIGADVPFFVYGYESANVEGIGEVIVPHEERIPNVRLHTPPIHCDTAAVYKAFRSSFFDKMDPDAAKEWLDVPSGELMESLEPKEANDLYPAALLRYPQLEEYAESGMFLSGSGSTLFEKI